MRDVMPSGDEPGDGPRGRTLDPEVVERTRRECEAQGLTLEIKDSVAIARLARSLFEPRPNRARGTDAVGDVSS